MNELKKRPVPELPEGYRVEGTRFHAVRLYFGNEVLVEYDPDFLPSAGLVFFGGYEVGECTMETTHAGAVIAFLQGAR